MCLSYDGICGHYTNIFLKKIRKRSIKALSVPHQIVGLIEREIGACVYWSLPLSVLVVRKDNYRANE